MSKADVQTIIIEPMQLVFLPPRDYSEQQQQASLAEYGEALAQFDPEDLKVAWGTVRNEAKTRTWPMPGMFVDAAHRARMQRQEGGRAASAATKSSRSPLFTWEIVKKGQKAKDAARLGVSWAFKLAVLDGREPSMIDLDGLGRTKARSEVLAARIENDKSLFDHNGRDIGVMRGQAKESALSMYRILQIREAETAQEIGYTGQIQRSNTNIDELLA